MKKQLFLFLISTALIISSTGCAKKYSEEEYNELKTKYEKLEKENKELSKQLEDIQKTETYADTYFKLEYDRDVLTVFNMDDAPGTNDLVFVYDRTTNANDFTNTSNIAVAPRVVALSMSPNADPIIESDVFWEAFILSSLQIKDTSIISDSKITGSVSDGTFKYDAMTNENVKLKARIFKANNSNVAYAIYYCPSTASSELTNALNNCFDTISLS